MKQFDVSAMIVGYNFVVGVLLMFASGRMASFLSGFGERAVRYTSLSVFTFGSCVAAVSGSVYLFVHLLKIGVD